MKQLRMPQGQLSRFIFRKRSAIDLFKGVCGRKHPKKGFYESSKAIWYVFYIKLQFDNFELM